MGLVATGFQQTFRDYNTDGVPSSGAHEVDKSDARQLGSKIEQLVGFLEIGIPSYATAAELPVDPVPAPGTMARVYADPTAEYNVFWVYNSGWVIDEDLMTAITVQLSAANTWTGVQAFATDIYTGLARLGRDGDNLRFGYGAVNPSATGLLNVGIGDDALFALTTGNRNVAVGSTSGVAITTGQLNVAIGYAGLTLTTGNYNVFIGPDAGASLTTTSSNVAIGAATMTAATGCNDCVAIGSVALRNAVGLLGTVAVGFNALGAVTTGAGNNALGHNAGGATTTGQLNTAFGTEALVSNVTGNNNCAFGAYALDGCQGSQNTAVGVGSAYCQRAGSDNVSIGFAAARGDQDSEVLPDRYFAASRVTSIGTESLRLGITDDSDDNTVVGYRAGYNTSGKDNSLFGSGAGSALTTGQRNIIVGKDKQADSNTANDQINIGDRFFHDRIRLLERSADPAAPAEGNCIVWMGDGTGKGDDGDVMIASTASGVTRWTTLFDHSAGATW